MIRPLATLCAIVVVAGCASPLALPSPASPLPEGSASPLPLAERREASAPEALVAVPTARPPQAPMSARFGPDLVEGHCLDRDLPAPTSGDPALTILDRTHGLGADDAPNDLVSASDAGLDGISTGQRVRAILIADLAAMASAWEAGGLTIDVESGYRSYADQAATFDQWVDRIGEEAARLRVARPGHSEHQLGTAMDVVSPGWSGRFGDWATESAEGAWMAEHAWEFGFVMSYPAGGEADTCFGYEPWHYRWVGRAAAAAHRASGLTLREFLQEEAGP